MTANGLRPYPAYKDSGVEWLGRVPKHWETVPLKRIGWFSSGAGFPIREQGRSRGEILFAKVSDMNRSGNRREIATTANSVTRDVARELGAHVFPPDTIVFPKVGGALLTNKRRILVRETCIDNNLMGYVVTGAETEFVFRLLRRLDLGRMAKPGPVPAISEGEVREVRIPLPPFPEQAAIAGYLNRADRRIRRYIRAKERLIGLLEERKRALIHEAVTGRIDVRTGQPYPAYRDSGVEWLGRVPEHWDVAGLGYRYEQCLGKMLDGKRITGEHLVPYLRNADVQWDEINVADLPRMDIRPDEMPRYTVQPGDLLVCEGGEVGRCAIWNGAIDGCGFQKALHRLRPRDDERDRPRFLYYALSVAVTRGAFADGRESTISHLTGEKLRRHRFAFPFTDEQTAIVRYLDHAVRRIRAAVSATQRQVALLREYRTRLIADVVTGKLDVREAVARPPETGPLADDRDRDDAIPTESNLLSTESHMAKEAIP